MATTYHVDVIRDGKWWMVHIPELDGLTQTRRLAEAEKEARDFIAVTCDVPPSSIEIELHIGIYEVEDVDVRAAAAEAARKKSEELRAEANAIMTALARDLSKAEVPVRDIGEILHVSHQRADQLVKGH